MNRRAWLYLLLAAASAAPASAHDVLPYAFKPDTGNVAALQRGARDFMNYCSGCHSLKYLRYNRLGRDLAIPDDLLQQNLMFTSGKLGDHILSSLPPADGEKWFGRAPPDLTLSARERGGDWIYNYLLAFYVDPTRPHGVNNTVLPNVSMPHVLGDLQGWQMLAPKQPAAGEGMHKRESPTLVLAQPGTMKPEEFRDFVSDLTNFLVYAAEPGRGARLKLGVRVLAFLVLFTVLAYLLKVEYWKDVH